MQKVTYNNLFDTFSMIASNHYQINSFEFGEAWDINSSGTTNYPLLLVIPETSTVSIGKVTYKFKLAVMDLVQKGKDNDIDVESDTHQILLDVIAELRMGGYDFSVDRNLTITLEQFSEKFDDEVTGWWGDIILDTDFDFDSCNIPTIN